MYFFRIVLAARRKAHTSEFKLKVVTRAEATGNRAAAREFGISESSVREWRKMKSELEKMSPQKCARRGASAKWPELENELKEWILARRKQDLPVSTLEVQIKAKLLATENDIANFKGSPSWISKLLKRNSLSIRTVKTRNQKNISTEDQQLPDDWQQKVAHFRECVSREMSELGLTSAEVVNMDEIPMSFNILSRNSSDKDIFASKRLCFTVILACTGNGGKLKPMVIFKGATMPRQKMPTIVASTCNEKGWVDGDLIKYWVDKCFSTRPGVFSSKRSLLVVDSMVIHKKETFQNYIGKVGAHVAIIPNGLTSKLQPLNIAVSRPFKAHLKRGLEEWMKSEPNSSGCSKSTCPQVCKLVASAWDSITAEMICSGFEEARICQCDGLYANVVVKTADKEEDDILPEVTKELFQEVQECFDECIECSSDFEGFDAGSDDEDDN